MRRSNDVDGRSPSPSRTRLDTAPVDWAAVTQSLINVAIAEERRNNQAAIAEAIAGERRFNHGVLAEVIAEMRATANDDLEHAVLSLTVGARRPQGDACRGAAGLRDRPHAGAGFAAAAEAAKRAAVIAEEDRMITRERVKVGIQIAARISELRRLAERTARDCEADVAADNTLPAEHRRLSRMLFAIAAARRGRKGAR